MTDLTADLGIDHGVHRPHRSLSRVLQDLSASSEGSVTVEQVRDALGDRSFTTFIAFVAVINCLPVPPFSTMILGIPMVLIAWQMVIGRERIWLPGFILRRSIDRTMFGHMTTRMIPWLVWMEKFIRPRRWPFANQRHADRVIGLWLLILAAAVVAPIPFGNWPPAFSVLIVSVAFTERDGVWLGIGTLAGIVSLAIIAIVVGSAGALAYWALG